MSQVHLDRLGDARCGVSDVRTMSHHEIRRGRIGCPECITLNAEDHLRLDQMRRTMTTAEWVWRKRESKASVQLTLLGEPMDRERLGTP